MTYTVINQLAIGQVGVSPNQFFLKTDLTLAQTEAPGFLNTLSATNGTSPSDGDFVLGAASDGSKYYTVKGDTLLPSGGGGGGSFQYNNTQWVAQNGSDANDGKSIDTPKLTVQAAITALAGDGALNIEDNGTYTGAWNIGTNDITINAPAAFLNTSGVTLGAGAIFKVNAYSFGTNFNNLFPAAANNGTVYINAQKVRGDIGNGTNNPVQLFINAQEITGDYTFGANLSAIISFETMAGSIIDTSPAVGTPGIGVFGRNLSGNISSTNSKIYGNLVSTVVGASITGIGFGSFNNLIDTVSGGYSDAIMIGGDLTIKSQSVRTAVAGGLENWALTKGGILSDGYIFKMSDSGKLFTYGGNSNITVFAPSDATVPWLPDGWFVCIQQDDFSGRVIVDMDPTGSGGVIVSSGGGNGTQGRGSLVTLNIIAGPGDSATRRYGLSGQTNSSFSSDLINTYVSALSGSDATGQVGLIQYPYATVTAAYAALSATFPSNKSNLVILDGEVYFGELTADNGNINIIGPQASMASSAGDAITTTFSGDQIQINLKQLYSTFGGGKALNNTGNNQIILNTDILLQGDVVQGGTGVIYIQSDNIQSPLICTAAGSIRFETAEFGGSFTPGPGTIKGVHDSGFVPPVSEPYYFSSTPVNFVASPVTLDATFLSGRVIQNSNAVTATWNMDTGTNLTAGLPAASAGDTFVVNVVNPVGALITVNGAADCNVIGTATAQTNFIITLRYGGGVTWDVFV